MVEDVHIVKSHAAQARIQAGNQILAAAAAAVRAVPHVIARLGADDQLVAVGVQILAQDVPEVLFGAARCGAVIVGEVKMRDAVVKCHKAHLARVVVGVDRTEVLPQTEADARQFQPRAPAGRIFRLRIARIACFVKAHIDSFSVIRKKERTQRILSFSFVFGRFQASGRAASTHFA